MILENSRLFPRVFQQLKRTLSYFWSRKLTLRLIGSRVHSVGSVRVSNCMLGAAVVIALVSRE